MLEKKFNILLVDDSEDNLIALEHLLSPLDVNIYKASSGSEAITVTIENSIQLILLDIRMPFMDGYGTAKAINFNKKQTIPIIFISSSNQNSIEITKTRNVGIVDFIFRPINSDILLRKIAIFTRLFQNEAELREVNKQLNKQNQKVLEANKELALNQKNKDAFFATISHEIRTPMNSIIGMTSLLKTTELSPEQLPYIEAIETAGNTLLTIINDILDISKIDAQKMHLSKEEFNLNELVAQTVRLFTKQLKNKRDHIYTLVKDHNFNVLGDGTRIRQILLNLINNSIKFTDEGIIKVSLDYKKLSTKKVQFDFTVSDTGVGFDQDESNSIFEQFYQTKTSAKTAQGTGLGLSICKKIVELMQGEIKASSRPGQGTSMTFTLNLDVKSSPLQITKSTTAQKTVWLISEDNNFNEYFKFNFSKDFYKIRIFSVQSFLTSASKQLPQSVILYKTDQIDHELEEKINTKIRQFKNEGKLTKSLLLLDYSNHNIDQGAMWDKIISPPFFYESLCDFFLFDDKIGKKYYDDFKEINAIKGIKQRDFSRQAIILIADDSAEHRVITEKTLKRFGCQCVQAKNGAEALAILQGTQIDLILMDCQMPVMDGYTASEAIRTSEDPYSTVPIIGMSAGTLSHHKTKALAAGMNDFASKPISIKQMRNMILKWLTIEKSAQLLSHSERTKPKLTSHKTNS